MKKTNQRGEAHMAEAKNVPRIRFPGFSGEWEQRKLGDVLVGLKNNTFSRAELSDKPGTAKNIHYGDILTQFGEVIDVCKTHLPTITDERTIVKYQDSFLQNGDIIVADTAEDSSVGKCCEIKGLNNELVLSGLHTIPYRPTEKFATGYLGYYMNSDIYHNQLRPLMQGIKVTAISKSAMSDTKICFPSSIAEQTKIADFFADLDALIASHRRELEDVRKLKRAMLQKMFPREGEVYPEVRFPGFTDAWETRKLGDVGTTFNGLSGKCADDFGHGDANFITYMNVFTNPITNPDMIEHVEIDSKQKEVQVGDVFFTTSSETPEEVGMSSVIKEKQGITYLNSFCFGFRPNVQFDLDYLAYMLRSETIRSQIKLLAQGISRFNISKKKMMDITIREPSFEEQNKIGDFFSTLDSLITLREREIEHLGELKKGLLQQMFCGI